MTDNEIIKALECCSEPAGKCCCEECPLHHREDSCTTALIKKAVELVNRQKSEIERYLHSIKLLEKDVHTANAEIERLKEDYAFSIKLNGLLQAQRDGRDKLINELDEKIEKLNRALLTAKSEAIKEFAEKITEIFIRYAHLHSHADCAEKDYIEAVDGTEIEMQSVWDVFTLKKYGLAEYEEMNRLQNNIELIEKGRLLTELEKDFKLLIKEMVGDDNVV